MPLVAALALLAVAGSGLTTYKKGWIAIRNSNLNINVLMSIAVTGALLLGQWPEAAMVMVLFSIAELIEAKSLDRARNAIQGLMRLAPEKATIRQVDGSWAEVEANSVTLGAVVRVKPGERIGLDGEITSGRSTINQAPITGESLPIEKGEGDAVFAGTINESGSFEYKVTAAANNTALARADIGFAMGAMGTDTAIETADVALMDDDLRKIPAFIRLSKATHSILVQNITLALGIKAVFLALTLAERQAPKNL